MIPVPRLEHTSLVAPHAIGTSNKLSIELHNPDLAQREVGARIGGTYGTQLRDTGLSTAAGKRLQHRYGAFICFLVRKSDHVELVGVRNGRDLAHFEVDVASHLELVQDVLQYVADDPSLRLQKVVFGAVEVVEVES